MTSLLTFSDLEIQPLEQNRLEEVIQLCAKGLQTLPARLGSTGLLPPPTEQAAPLVKPLFERLLASVSTELNGAGWVALDSVGGRVRAVIAGYFYRLDPSDPTFTYMPPRYSSLVLPLCEAESDEAVRRCYPALFEVWREEARRQGIERLQVQVLAGQWLEGAVWRGLGFEPDVIMTAQPLSVEPVPASVQAQPDLIVRQATQADLDSLTDLALEEHLYHAHQTRTGTSPDQPRATSRAVAETSLKEAGATHRQLIAKSRVSGKAGGCTVGSITEIEPERVSRFYMPARYGYIGLTSVGEGERGRGVGQALVHELRKWFREQGMEYVLLHYVADNLLSNRFWSRQGFAPYTETLTHIIS